MSHISNPQPGDLVLEVTTAFRWLGRDRLAPGEALGELLRIDGEEWVLRPIFEPEGTEFRWRNCKFIVAKTVHNGVCLMCGSGVLEATGEHIRDDLPPCSGALVPDRKDHDA